MAERKRRQIGLKLGRKASAESLEKVEGITKKIKEEEDTLIDGVYLNEESNTQITRLFKIIDVNSDGCIDINDFTLNGELTGPLAEKWLEIRDKFDYNADGQVSLEEFRRGLKKHVLKLVCPVSLIPQNNTIEGYIRALESHVNGEVQDLCKNVYLWYNQ